MMRFIIWVNILFSSLVFIFGDTLEAIWLICAAILYAVIEAGDKGSK